MTDSGSELDPYLDYLSLTIRTFNQLMSRIPGSEIIYRYIKSSHQNDPFRTLLELLLVFFVIRTWRQSRTRGDFGPDQSFLKLTEKVDELIAEWEPEPLVEPIPVTTQSLSRPPIIIGIPDVRPKILYGEPALRFVESSEDEATIDPKDIRTVTNLASINFAGLIGDERVKLRAIEQLRRSGVGSCGPPGFYGTFDVHMELERDIAQFIGLPSSIIYAQGFSTTSSVIPAFSKRGDIIVVDRGANFSIQKGIQISRSTIRWYDHNDYNSLERVLEQLKLEEIKFRRKLTRKFIITEGLFECDGTLCNLKKIIELKEKYKFRLILDETWSIGSIGVTGRGLTEYFGIHPESVDILVGSLATSFNSGGGFCAGSKEVVSHQRINSAALVFSAALPPLLATAASETIKILSEKDGLQRFERLRKNTEVFREILDEIVEEGLVDVPSNRESPMVHINLRPMIGKSVSSSKRPSSSSSDTTTTTATMTTTNATSRTTNKRNTNASSVFEEHERILQTIVDKSVLEKNVLITRTKKVWEQEIDPPLPSIRICLSAGLGVDEVSSSGKALVKVIREVLNFN
ncbi:pyridoxal phosphate-dependent transferase [Phakopsora pachyrhizi]|uniref:serine C-palmitoyltransferase n=1 Tax=Phakopsora pachyrhizi TaxID=170000 RepID=A0AAV0AFG2_PHAPC|nr:pyridoxal phosphate-dependent transferase [Phakopsora pachyrhizi]